MFIPNITGLISSPLPTNVYGESSYGPARVIACAVVHLTKSQQKTSVRTDSTASRGEARENISVTKILFPSTETVAINDRLEINGQILRIIGVETRYHVLGNIDHYEADADIWFP